MSPDDRTRRVHDDVVMPFDNAKLDPELTALDAELAKAGMALRRSHERDGRSRPSAAFASSLRERLLTEAAMPIGADARAAEGRATAGAGATADSLADNARRVHPQIRRRTPTILPAPRWSVLALAAVFVVALLGFNSRGWFTGPAPVRATDVAGASLIRGGTSSALAVGASLEVGDQVSVDQNGHAVLAVGGGLVRLDAGASIRLDRLSGEVSIEQLGGRVWHRVQAGTSYTVSTGKYRWTALGTAFSLAIGIAGSEAELALVAVEHAVDLAGPSVAVRVEQGSRAVIGASAAQWAVGPATQDELGDPWLIANAQLDAAAGFGVGVLQTALGSPTPRPSLTPAPVTPGPSLPAGTSGPGSSPSAEPTPTDAPTSAPTAKPTATPKPTPTVPPIGSLGASVLGCGEVAVVSWDAYGGSRFAKLVVVRGASSFSIPTSYPPGAGLTALGDSLTTSPAAASYGDALGTGSSAWYRVLVLDAGKHTIAASAARKATAPGIADLGPFVPTPVAGGIEAAWTPYGGSAGCFVYYKIVWSATDLNPSYVGGNYDGYEVVGSQADSAYSFALAAGTYHMRIEALRYADAGTSPILVGRSSVALVTVP